MSRTAKKNRKTNETDITVEMNLDGTGQYDIDTGVGFLDHMLTHLGKHSKIDLVVKAKGDLEVDAHHTVEDVGIAIGEALLEAMGGLEGQVAQPLLVQGLAVVALVGHAVTRSDNPVGVPHLAGEPAGRPPEEREDFGPCGGRDSGGCSHPFGDLGNLEAE